MNRPSAVLCAALLLLGAASAAVGAESRTFTFQYATSVGPVEAGAGPVHVWVPLPVQDAAQRVVAEQVEASIPGAIEVEPVYGNRFWHGQLERSDGQPIRIAVATTVERRTRHRDPAAMSQGVAEGDAERRYLGPNARVPVGHPVLDPIRAEVRAKAGSEDKAAVSRAIYDWVVDNVEYKKVGRGWGNGDTFWACSERYGNCTDFHALFISLARSEGIPARFEIGFPIPEDLAEGEIGGYHCWVQYYLPETDWFPIDASEASKHPEKRELFYGTQPPDRIHFSTGRDLVLGASQRGEPLNYFVYPYVEVDGRRFEGGIESSFAFREGPGAGSGGAPGGIAPSR